MQKKSREKTAETRLAASFLKGSKRYFGLAVVFTAVTALADMLSPQIIRAAIDYCIGGAVPDYPAVVMRLVEYFGGFAYLGKHIWMMAAALMAVALVKALGEYCFAVCNAKGAETLVKTMRDALFSHIERLPFAWHRKNQTGDIIQRCTSDISTFQNFISAQLTTILRMVILLVLSISFMLSMNPLLALISFIPLPFITLYSWRFHKKIGTAFLECDRNEGKLSAMVQENLTGVRVVRAFGREAYEREKMEAHNNFYTGLWEKVGGLMGRFWGLSDALCMMQGLLVVIFGAVFCVKGKLTAGEYVVFFSYNELLCWPFRQLGQLLSEMSKAGVSLGRVREIMEQEEEKIDENALTPPLDRDIVFDGVTFAYAGKANILNGVSLTVPAGTTLGILGGTGSGKSTLMLLLDKLYDLPASGGKITVGGVDLADIRTDYLRKNIGLVLQEPFLFSRTLAENIAIGDDSLTMEDIERAAKAACLDEAVAQFTKGYDTFVGERGVTLSGGQKQRTAIARTLTGDCPILIFDDSLSAVDTETDAKIRKALHERFGKATVFLISHRITTLAAADQIVVLDHGKVAELGTHEQLKNAGGIYSRIYEIQSGSEVRV